MKKLFYLLMVAAVFASCSQNSNEASEAAAAATTETTVKAAKITDEAKSPIEVYQARVKELDRKMKRRGADKDSLQALKDAFIRETCETHCGDSLGLMITLEMAKNFTIKQIDSAMSICDLYANDPTLQYMAKLAVAAEATAVGKKYVDIKGLNVANDKKTLALSSVLAKGKPVLVNFWGSWNIPSRDVIRTQLMDLEREYASKITFCSVAVWEDSITFVHRATDEMLIDWPSIYTEGRVNSPVDAYGAQGIPFIMLISPSGIIKARNIKAEEIKEVLDKELGK